MADADHLAVLRQGATAWNRWRNEKKPWFEFRPDFDGADLHGANLRGADLSQANLSGADLSQADLSEADLSGANLSEADLSGADIRRTSLVGTNLKNADLTGCFVYGTSAWGLKLNEDTKQRDLVITERGEPEITVDNIEVAQFVYLLLHNEKIRDVIDTITSKAVLILGRFAPERKEVLDTLRDELRKRDYLPILFDFFHRYPWVLETHRYDSQEQLVTDLSERVIRPAETKVLELRRLQPR